LLVLTGGTGLAVVPPVAAWIVYLATIVWRGGQKGKALALVILALLPLVYFVPYFTDYHEPPHRPPTSHNPLAISVVAGEVLAMGLGIGDSGVWWTVFAAELVLGVVTAVMLFRTNRGDLTATLGLLALALGVGALVLLIGYGRAAMGLGMGLYSRYGLLTWPLLAAMYLVWVKTGRKWVPIALCLAAALAFPPNMGTGMIVGNETHEQYEQIAIDMQRGLSAEEIYYSEYFQRGPNATQGQRVLRGIPMLREAGIGVFAGNPHARP
jgi:hypothetical protein